MFSQSLPCEITVQIHGRVCLLPNFTHARSAHHSLAAAVLSAIQDKHQEADLCCTAP